MSLAREAPRQRNRNTAWLAGGAAALAAIGLGAWAFTHNQPVSATAARRDIIAYAAVEGEVIVPAGARADVMPAYKAPVAKVYTAVGQNVKRGDVMVELSFPSVQAAYEQARANVKAAETAYANAERQYAASVTSAQRQVDAARAAEQAARRPVVVTPAPTTTPDGTVVTPPPATAPAPSGDVVAASQNRAVAEQALASAISERDAALLPFKQALESARAAFQDAKQGRKMAMVRAPIAGTILALNAAPGGTVGENSKTPIATIVDLSALKLQGEVPASQAASVKPDLPAVCAFAGLPAEKLDGEVDTVVTTQAGLLKKTKYLAVLDFKNPKGAVKPGTKGTASIRLGEAKNVVAVPAGAVTYDDKGQPMVRVRRGNAWETEMVEVGLSDGRFTEIKNGVKEGDTVQVKPEVV